MKVSKAYLIISALLSISNPSNAQTIVVANSTCARPSVCLSSNQVSFGLENLVFDPADGDARRRFEAFWVTGDGNYIQFDPAQDALSLNPRYFYSSAGNHEASVYLTGKYTNRIPPARAAQPITIAPLSPTSTTTAFKGRLGKAGSGSAPKIDLFSNHDIKKKNLTTFVISWPGDVNATGLYFFFNGYKHSISGEYIAFAGPIQPLKYELTDVPTYFKTVDADGRPLFFDSNKIGVFNTSVLAEATPVDNLNFQPVFSGTMPGKFGQFVYFPAETATQADMPPNFTENRLFVVLRADSTFVPQDTFMNFMVMLTGSKPNPDDDQLQTVLAQLNPDMVPSAPIGFSTQQQAVYVQAVAELQLHYLTTFDPNQLTVENISSLGSDEYEVTFRLEMCNKGRGIVENEDVSLTFPDNFHSFTPLGFSPVSSSQTTTEWNFRVAKTILGVELKEDGSHEESVCESIMFTARTNCAGVRSLWKSEQATPVQSCVVFDGAIPAHPECHTATAIDSTRYGCLCCIDGTGNRGGGTADTCWPLWLLLILVVIAAIWWAYKQNND